MKWDGYRAIVEVRGGTVRIASRRGLDASARYPELRPLADATPVDDLVVDGELVVLDGAGRPSFAAIQQHRDPATLMIFDVLRVDGRDVTPLSWKERRQILERLALRGPTWQTPAVATGDADTALAAAAQLQLEGIVAKRIDSPYRPGRRTTAWLKVKIRNRQELVVGGWLPGEGRLSGTVGSLLVGYYEQPGDESLVYAGRVGSGLDDALRDTLAAQLVARPTSPFQRDTAEGGRGVGRAGRGRRGRVHGVDRRRRAPPAGVPRPPRRQGPPRGDPRSLIRARERTVARGGIPASQ